MPDRATRLRELARVFLKLGTTAFGGPAAHVALMEVEVVRRRGWLTHEEFLDLLAAANLIPGPNSTELVIHIGRQRAGWAGLLVAGACFILPAALMVTALGWAYVRFGKLPELTGILYGVKPVIIAVIAQAIWMLGRKALKSRGIAFLAVIGGALNASGVHELVVLFGAGAVWGMASVWDRRRPGGAARMASVALPGPLLAAAPAIGGAVASVAAAPFSLTALFVFFAKVGAVLFGSGYVLLAFLQSDLVERWHWLTQSQLLDAIAVGQVTPGPLFTTATFVGYLLGGMTGAVVATAGIFLPAFVFVALSAPLIPRMRASPLAASVLDGVNAASLALMAVVTVQVANSALVDVATVLLAVASTVLLLRFRVNSIWLVLGGAAVGMLRVLLLS